MNDIQKEFIRKAAAEAERVQHPFALMAACEAALESNYGKSELARDANNLFGMKQHTHAIYGTLNLPTREFVGKEKDTADGNCDGWIQVTARWVNYPDWASCFRDRLATLERLSNAYPHYKAALEAQDEESYVKEVSKTWSTDPERARKVISIFQESLS